MLTKMNEPLSTLTNTKKQGFEPIKRVRKLIGQYGNYEFLFELTPVSNDLTLAAICTDTKASLGFCLLLHHTDAVYLRNVKSALQSSHICDSLEFIERFKVKNLVSEGEPEYYVALKIANTPGTLLDQIKEDIEFILEDIKVMMHRCRPGQTVKVVSDFTSFNF